MGKICRIWVLIVLSVVLGKVTCVYSQAPCKIKDGYAYFEKNPKTLGVDFFIGIPDEWVIQKSELPNIVAEMCYGNDVQVIIGVEAGDTFVSRSQARIMVNSGEIERIFAKEHEMQGFGTVITNATSEIVDSYPGRRIIMSLQRDDFVDGRVVKNPYVGEIWTIFYEDVQISIMAFCSKQNYKKYSYIFYNIVKSMVFLS